MKNQLKKHWFHTKENLKEKEITLLDKELVHQMTKVLKFHPGDEVVLVNGCGTIAISRVNEINSNQVRVTVINVDNREQNNKTVNLFFAIPKKSKFELILEKGTEIGVRSFQPIITDRTEKLNINQDRAEKIVREAMEQSERAFLPKIFEPKKLSDILNNLNKDQTYAFHTIGENFQKHNVDKEVNILIGPEGGWSDREMEEFKKLEFKIFKVGDGILKTETAAIVLPSLFLY